VVIVPFVPTYRHESIPARLYTCGIILQLSGVPFVVDEMTFVHNNRSQFYDYRG